VGWISNPSGQGKTPVGGLTFGENLSLSSFFVRHAYFTGADEPYEKLKRALRAEVDEAAWQALYSTTSRPFPLPKSKKIAVKVINHYGDEVLKVCAV
jgi:adenine-specific DNA-methyltransferase